MTMNGKNSLAKKTLLGAWCAGLFFLTLVWILFAYSLSLTLTQDLLVPRHLFGNRSDVIDAIQQTGKDGRLYFAVIGDVNNLGIHHAAELAEKARERGVQFLILGGDLARFGQEERISHSVQSFYPVVKEMPVLLVPGNHDLYPDATIFERVFGPRRFFFVHNDCLFVVIDTGKGMMNEEDYFWISAVLKENASAKRKFVFSHRPLFNWDNPESKKDLPNDAAYANFRALFDLYKVDHVFSGHVHDFFTKKEGYTSYIVIGGAESKDIGDPLEGMALVEYKGADVSVEIVKSSASKSPFNYFRMLSMVRLYPWYKEYYLLLTIICMAALVVWAYSVSALYRRWGWRLLLAMACFATAFSAAVVFIR